MQEHEKKGSQKKAKLSSNCEHNNFCLPFKLDN
jgi:hypothetical protein